MMKSLSRTTTILILCTLFTITIQQQQLSPSQSKTLLRLQHLLEYPQVLSSWSSTTPFCSLPSTPSLTITCTSNRVTALSITGNSIPRSSNFSSDSLFVTLSRLPDLTSLSLVALGLWGPLPSKLDRLSDLKFLDLSSNHFTGAIPAEISTMPSLHNIVLANNSFNGTVPDFRPLKELFVIDLSGNRLGPDFPSLSSDIQVVLLRGNSFKGRIPAALAGFNKLQRLDLSGNSLSGWIPFFLFSLPSLQYLSLSNNRLTGQLNSSVSCGTKLSYVDISNNLLTGALPACISSNLAGRVVRSSGNCLNSGPDLKKQHANGYCNGAAIAAVLPPATKISGSKSNLGLVLGIVGGVVAGIVLVGLVAFLVFKRVRTEEPNGSFLPKPVPTKTAIQPAPRTPADARHMSQAVRIGTLGMPTYRVFNVEELEEATNNFDTANLIEDGPKGQFYNGRLQDGSMVMIRGLKLKQKFLPQTLLQCIDLISKLRHRHLVSMIGHCLVSRQDGVNTTTIMYLVTEYVSNGTLRSHLTEWRKREMLKWPQRVAAVIGVARGVQFLHTVTLPGIVKNDLNIENIMLDQTLNAKVSNYNLPVLPKAKNNKVGCESPFVVVDDGDLGSWENGEKEDIYQLGLILLEIITGKPTGSKNELDSLRIQLQKSLTDSEANLKAVTDQAIRGTFALDSLKTVIELALNCTSINPKERPSIDDVLWNLQYSGQVQDGWASNENLNLQS